MIKKITNLPPLPQGALLVSLDISSLYTNILMTEALKISSNVLRTHRDPNALPKNIELLHLLSLVLTCNNFEFNREHFLQIQEVAMGTKCSPTIANLTMGDFEDQHVYTYHLQPLIWYRFIDDIFMIWTHGQEALDAFRTHRTIKFTYKISNTQISFLDIIIKKDEDGVMYTDLYTKPTDTHSYLHYGSCHPKYQKTGGPYSQLVRICRICSRDLHLQLTAVVAEVIKYFTFHGNFCIFLATVRSYFSRYPV